MAFGDPSITGEASSGLTVLLVAADVSGDQNGARLADALRQYAPNVRLIGAGGCAMREAGVELAVESEDVSMVGPPSSLGAVRAVFRVWRQLGRAIAENRPDAAVLIDNEMLNLLFARKLRSRGVPVAFFFPPQVWFWGRWRLRWIMPMSMRMLCAFKPEADFYLNAGADAVWTGHPLRDVVRVRDDAAAAMRSIGLDPNRPLVVLMPGSRSQEIRFHCSLMTSAALLLRQKHPDLQFAIPLASESLRTELESQVHASGLQNVSIYVPRSYAVLSRARAVLQCSGTATIEAALLGIPSVIVYQCPRLHHMVARRLMHVSFIGMPNILLGEMVQPEFFGSRIDSRRLAGELSSLLIDEKRRGQIRRRLAELPEMLGPTGAVDRAAASVLEMLPKPLGEEVRDRRRARRA